MTTTHETHPFQAEVRELLGLVIHSLYKERRIFLRELVSNASDAIEKRRHEALVRGDAPPIDAWTIRIVPDRAARTLAVVDEGIGMSHDELVSNLGTIARSGTRAFVERMKSSGATDANLIGQFGVGFYSSFMVADSVVVETRRDGESGGWRWRSDGKGEFSIEAIEKGEVGTRVTLHLAQRKDDEDDDPAEFLEEATIREIVERYSDFVPQAITMEVADGADSQSTRLVTLNSRKPLWSRPKEEITRDEYAEFYRRLTHDWTAPREVVHFRAEGTIEFTALLFVPATRPHDLLEGPQSKSRVALFVKRVLIMAECPDLLPPWLRFVRGLVDSPDLPLNVSRDVLQSNPEVRAIHKRLVKRVLESLAAKLAEDRAQYAEFWRDFGSILKEGIWFGGDEDGRISKLALFESTHSTEPTTLQEYVARKKPDQSAIWFLAGSDRRVLEGSPHLERFRKSGQEVLFLVDSVDEWVLERLREFEGLPLRAIDRGDAAIESPSEKEARESLDREHRDLLGLIETRLAADVKCARFTTRLSESPAVLVDDTRGVSANMERILRAANQPVQHEKRILELNPDHALVKHLAEAHAADPRSERVGELVELLHGTALLSEGSAVGDTARFAKLVTKLVAGS